MRFRGGEEGRRNGYIGVGVLITLELLDCVVYQDVSPKVNTACVIPRAQIVPLKDKVLVAISLIDITLILGITVLEQRWILSRFLDTTCDKKWYLINTIEL